MSGGIQNWYVLDHQYSIKQILDNSGNSIATQTYNAWGGITSATGSGFQTESLGHTGTTQDKTTGYIGNDARFYDPFQGKFTSEDPSSFSAGDSNLYRYVANNVTTGKDPSGLQQVTSAGGLHAMHDGPGAMGPPGMKGAAPPLQTKTEEQDLPYEFPIELPGDRTPTEFELAVEKELERQLPDGHPHRGILDWYRVRIRRNLSGPDNRDWDQGALRIAQQGWRWWWTEGKLIAEGPNGECIVGNSIDSRDIVFLRNWDCDAAYTAKRLIEEILKGNNEWSGKSYANSIYGSPEWQELQREKLIGLQKQSGGILTAIYLAPTGGAGAGLDLTVRVATALGEWNDPNIADADREKLSPLDLLIILPALKYLPKPAISLKGGDQIIRVVGSNGKTYSVTRKQIEAAQKLNRSEGIAGLKAAAKPPAAAKPVEVVKLTQPKPPEPTYQQNPALKTIGEGHSPPATMPKSEMPPLSSDGTVGGKFGKPNDIGPTNVLKESKTELSKKGEDLFVGTYSQSRNGNLKSGLNSTHTPHHSVQDAVGNTSHGTGVTINMRKDLHAMTRTYRKPVEKGLSSRQHLGRDVSDIKRILTDAGYERSKINAQLQELIRQNKANGGFGK